MKALVIGGAGFIGSHLVDGLLEEGHSVRVFDNLDPQVHGPGQKIPDYLNPKTEFVLGDVLDRKALHQALKDVDVLYYKAAAVGVGQSMYEISRYVETNALGAANVLDLIVNEKLPIKKIIVASSMSVYGEGTYRDAKEKIIFPKLRGEQQLAAHEWDYRGEEGEVLEAVATNEEKPLFPTSVYAITKRDHEELFHSVGAAYDIPVVALRYFNVYGTRQALSNPYTGVAAIFSSRILCKQPPLVFEDGKQQRDFVHVSDIVQANLLALQSDQANGEAINIGSGNLITVLDIADKLTEYLGGEHAPEIVNKFRAGDIRHCFADVSKAKKLLGYTPRIRFDEGIKDLADWVKTQVAQDKVVESTQELSSRNLLR